MFCKKCGAQIHEDAIVCVSCGCAIERNNGCDSKNDPNTSPFNGLAVLLLCFFLGWIGVHRFYVGKTGTGIAMLLTGGGCGIWTLIDFIMILTGDFTDSEERRISLNSK